VTHPHDGAGAAAPLAARRRARAQGAWLPLAAFFAAGGAHAADAALPADDLDPVVVTGSRIDVTASEAVTPVVVIDASELERRRPDSLGDVLQQLPHAAGTQQNTNVNNGGDGSTRLSLRAFGEQRTLVLLNGRRLPNGGVGGDDSVDLSSLPMSIVERVEVLTGGASAIYGADAVAGVVNVITRRPTPGLTARAERAISTRNDGEILSGQLSGGIEAFGGAWLLGLDYARQDGVRHDERGFSAVPTQILTPGGTPQFVGSGNIPSGTFTVPVGNRLGLAPGAYTHTGTIGNRTAANYRTVSFPADSFNFAPYNYLQTPNERGSAWLLGTQPLGDAELFFEGTWHRRESSQRLAPTPYVTGVGVAPILPNGRPGIPATNFYNPFGANLPRASRRFVELAERGFDQEVTAWRALAGLRGDLGRWRYEVAAAESRSTSDVVERGLTAGVRLQQALGPSGRDAAGRVVCGPPNPTTGIVPAASVIAGCVPLDIFGGPGSITPDMLGFVSVDLEDAGRNGQTYVDVGFDGPWGRLPAGEIRWALGAEYRKDTGRYDYDPLRIQGVAGSVGTPLPSVSFSAKEAYAEARAPLLADAPFARTLDLVGAVRYADFTSFGSNTTWSGGLYWSPATAWSARAVYARVYRAPSLSELYRANSLTTTLFTTDPCGNNPTPAQRVNCAADGVPGGAYVQNVATGFEVIGGGNPNLRPERGDTVNAGFSWRSADALRLSFDWFRIDLPGYVQSADAQSVLDECANRGQAATCGLTTRFADGSLDLVEATTQNFGRVVTSGVDHEGTVAFDALAGRATLDWRATWVQRFDAQRFPGAPTIRGAGGYNPTLGPLPRWRAGGDASWQRGGLRLGYALQYVGGFRQCGGSFVPDSTCRDAAQAVYHDVDAWYSFASGVRVYGGLRNALDRQPPYVDGGQANTDPGSYRLLGRTWYAGLAMEFGTGR
jgi:outer membrane receptor protein involved in Fe transport